MHTEASCSEVCCQHDRAVSRAELPQNPLALNLALLAMNRHRRPPVRAQTPRQLIAALLGGAEDQPSRAFKLGVQQLRQRAELVSLREREELLGNVLVGLEARPSHGDAHWAAGELAGQRVDLLWPRCAPQQRLALRRHLQQPLPAPMMLRAMHACVLSSTHPVHARTPTTWHHRHPN